MILVESFSELLGYISICCWLGAQFPQLLENIKQQSCESLALPFLFNWMLGDVSNLIGCLLTHQLPFQTYLATYFCLIDCFLLSQYFYYGGGPKTPPISYTRPRSRTASSARRLSVDASHYRTLSATAGSIAAAAALAAHPDSHPEHRRPKRFGEEHPIDEPVVTPRASDEALDEVSDAVLSALSDSFHSENGRRKRVSWSRERREHPPGGSARSQMSPVVHGSIHPASAAVLARGRSLQRGEGSEDLVEEDDEETARRTTSRASRRSAGMVLLSMGALFGFGRYIGGAHALAGRREATGTVLAPRPSLNLMATSGLPVVHDPIIHLPDPSPSSINVEVPSLLNDVIFNHHQPGDDATYERIVGRIFAWLCTTLYLTSRLPQIWKNFCRKSVEGLSMYLFIFAFLGNFFYVLSILTSPNAFLPPPASTEFFRESIPYLLGSGGTFIFDITIVTQSFIYRGKHPRRGYSRSRGNSLVRSAALAEETAGLLRGDTLAEAHAHSQWAHGERVIAPHLRTRT